MHKFSAFLKANEKVISCSIANRSNNREHPPRGTVTVNFNRVVCKHGRRVDVCAIARAHHGNCTDWSCRIVLRNEWNQILLRGDNWCVLVGSKLQQWTPTLVPYLWMPKIS
ncbi:UNVERIFIED_CONTAM: hypothetical protein Sangu_1429200 [Sesamum angustifolium]|uniref:S-protein homolog n=1 Tax=Sesamum angustifolium TaxID=2727405 RepID=A0AAW2N9E6_9LAMI